jgi:glycosyltransferase involved in cell wall biosynthesis
MKDVSIITVCLNDAEGLKRTLESISSQSALSSLESVVIDGGSSDGTLEIIDKYVKDGIIVKWISEKDDGIYHAMNKGIKLAIGKHCLFLNAGDLLFDDTVIANVLKNKLDKDIVYGNYEADGKVKIFGRKKINLKYFVKSYLPHPASFISTALLNKLGGYVESFKIVGDYELFLRAIIKHKASHKHIPVTVSTHALDGISSKPYNLSLIREETKNALQMNISRFYLTVYMKAKRLKL